MKTLLLVFAALLFSKTGLADDRFVVFHVAGPNWDESKDMFSQKFIFPDQSKPEDPSSHVVQMRKLMNAGKMLAGGPFDKETAKKGEDVGMVVPMEGVTKAELESWAAEDPAVKNGVLKVELRAWKAAMSFDCKEQCARSKPASKKK